MIIKKLALACVFSLSTIVQASTITINDSVVFTEYSIPVDSLPSPRGADLLVIGVYETMSDGLFQSHTQGTANVNIIDQGATPLTLVLSSYEPTLWNLNIDNGVNINEIILNGYYEHEVSGADGITVTNRSGPGKYFTSSAYKWPQSYSSSDTPKLISEVEAYTGLTLTAFSGAYRASDFTVTTTPVPLPPAFLFLASSLIGLFGFRKKCRRQAQLNKL